jgi:predicted dehydrogenase
MLHYRTNRRHFLKSAALASGAVFAPAFHGNTLGRSPSDQINIALIGCGGRGGKNLLSFEPLANIVAFADVDEGHRTVPTARERHPNAAFFKDYRRMFDEVGHEIDAVVVSTPDHSHFAASMWALHHGKPVYTEKPLCRTIGELRDLKTAAAKAGVATQMGNQSFSNDGIRVCREWIEAGLIGTVREVRLWTDRPSLSWMAGDRSQMPEAEPVRDGLDWDLWLNTAPYTPYNKRLMPGSWRSWWRFGSGALGDIGCHMMGVPFYALGLKAPSKIEAEGRRQTAFSVALQEKVVYHFDSSSQGNPIKMTWISGFRNCDSNGKFPEHMDLQLLPELPDEFPGDYQSIASNGQFIIGDEGVIYIPQMHLGKQPKLLPEEKWNDVRDNLPEPKYTRFLSHHENFLQAIRGEIPQAASDFSCSADLAEIVQLGNLAIRSGEPIVWDAENETCVGSQAATALVRQEVARPEFLPQS